MCGNVEQRVKTPNHAKRTVLQNSGLYPNVSSQFEYKLFKFSKFLYRFVLFR